MYLESTQDAEQFFHEPGPEELCCQDEKEKKVVQAFPVPSPLEKLYSAKHGSAFMM